MTNHWKRGGVTVIFRDDRTLSVYAPDESRVLSAGYAEELAGWLAEQYNITLPPAAAADTELLTEREANLQATIARLAIVTEALPAFTPPPPTVVVEAAPKAPHRTRAKRT